MHPSRPIGQQIDTASVGPLFLLGQIAGRNGKAPGAVSPTIAGTNCNAVVYFGHIGTSFPHLHHSKTTQLFWFIFEASRVYWHNLNYSFTNMMSLV